MARAVDVDEVCAKAREGRGAMMTTTTTAIEMITTTVMMVARAVTTPNPFESDGRAESSADRNPWRPLGVEVSFLKQTNLACSSRIVQCPARADCDTQSTSSAWIHVSGRRSGGLPLSPSHSCDYRALPSA